MLKLNTNERIFKILSSADSQHALVERCWLQYKARFSESIRIHGKSQTLVIYKEMYTFMVNRTLKMAPTPFQCWHKTDRKGIPKPLWPLRPLMDKDKKLDRLLLTITRIFQTIRLPLDPDFDKITDPGVELQESFLCDFEEYVKRWCSNVVVESDKNLKSKKMIRTTKKGPNGPALATAPLDAQALAADPKLKQAIKEYNTLTGNEQFNEMLEANTFSEEPGRFHSRLGFSQEGGGKTRIFAICDYWSQVSVYSLHKNLSGILRRLRTDATYDQDKGFDRILKESRGKETFCFDLSGASDRIPVKLQEMIISEIYGPDLARNWRSILTDRVFHSKYGQHSWTVGQPLGLLSSWPAFALWHHIIIEYLAFKEGIKSFREYQVLGDDVVIWNSKVGESYREFIPSIGIPINETKSLMGTSANSQVEFAKRIAIDGLEMSGISYNIISKSGLGYIPALLQTMLSRNLVSKGQGCFTFIPASKYSQDKINFIVSYYLRAPVCSLPKGITYRGIQDFTAVDEKIIELRTDRLIETLERTSEFSDFYVPDYLERLRVPYNPTALRDLEGPNPNRNVVHPLYVVQEQLGENLMSLLLSINMYDPSEEDLAQIEYVPSMPGREYFFSSLRKSEYMTTLLVDAQRSLDGG